MPYNYYFLPCVNLGKLLDFSVPISSNIESRKPLYLSGSSRKQQTLIRSFEEIIIKEIF